MSVQKLCLHALTWGGIQTGTGETRVALAATGAGTWATVETAEQGHLGDLSDYTTGYLVFRLNARADIPTTFRIRDLVGGTTLASVGVVGNLSSGHAWRSASKLITSLLGTKARLSLEYTRTSGTCNFLCAALIVKTV